VHFLTFEQNFSDEDSNTLFLFLSCAARTDNKF